MCLSIMQLERWSDSQHTHSLQQQQEAGSRPGQEQQEEQQDPAQPQEQSQPQPQQQVPVQPSYRYQLQLLVPPGQLELGRRLITTMYSSSPDLSDLGAQQLMQLVMLAECYGVGKVVAAVAAQMHKMYADTMPLGVAASVFELPEPCLALEAFKPVQATAASKLLEQLGDLEVALGDEAKHASLLDLPWDALLHLLLDERTQVASEDTVLYTVATWLQRHGCTPSRARQVLDVLRLPHCSPSCLHSRAVKKVLKE
jgi:hypothetical protein